MRKKLILLIIPACFALFVALPVWAQFQTNTTVPKCDSSTVCMNNPLGNITTPQQLIGKVISAVLGIVGSLALLMFIFGGLIWMTAAGNEKKVTQGRDILMWAAIGLIVIFISYAAVRFLLREVLGV
ncbi:hypothetical protein COX68_02360 [Candidatus Falkowbacteria bacterium CG_4_10_14_0_2_um_filter_41_15]|uniref:TrbC/VIRB2 family protein n=2 Tax=Candidatus Falkowiibacteriota TaxID=1752728 RepID=A0A2M6WNG8_9BACT|nr:MAG: hypothetical protein COT98_04305 [Candidatus Falkowbacteria bacterium CG10_big_fil_rev_8_21_14_0_10_39_9]PJA09648.1 MAG: hypothetical protein COX68_02360 [Candidatus Falkowbacteria bacterium CG_4_10_14_0_2_um_filter_41_15]